MAAGDPEWGGNPEDVAEEVAVEVVDRARGEVDEVALRAERPAPAARRAVAQAAAQAP